MSTLTEMKAPQASTEAVVSAPFFYRGEVAEGMDETHRSRDLGVTFATPRIALDKAVPARSEVPPLLNVPVSEIIDFLASSSLASAMSARAAPSRRAASALG